MRCRVWIEIVLWFAIVFAAGLMLGCTPKPYIPPPAPEPITVYVPVAAQCPAPAPITPPDYWLSKLDIDTAPPDVVEAARIHDKAEMLRVLHEQASALSVYQPQH